MNGKKEGGLVLGAWFGVHGAWFLVLGFKLCVTSRNLCLLCVENPLSAVAALREVRELEHD